MKRGKESVCAIRRERLCVRVKKRVCGNEIESVSE